MAKPTIRKPFGEQPAMVRFDLRITDTHPRLKAWVSGRTYQATPLVKAALEAVIERAGEEGLDRLLENLARGLPQAGSAKDGEGQGAAVAPPPSRRPEPLQPISPSGSESPQEGEASTPVPAPGVSPLNELANLGVIALRDNRQRNVDALLRNEALFNIPTKG